MPDYFEWNRALIEYFMVGAPEGSTIYLDVNDRSLEQVGRQFWPDERGVDWAQQYLTAVRRQVVTAHSEPLVPLRIRDPKGRPYGVAFLGVLVLVATRMDNDDEQQISEKDYFTRLNEALGTKPLNQQVRRPRLMKQGSQAEEPLWKEWAAFLRESGYLPTASGGKGAWKYIGYAVSQTLLRPPEKRRLFKIFDEKRWPEDIDPDLLVSHLRREDALPAHVQSLLKRTGQAAEDVQHAISETFAEWLEGGVASGPQSRSTSRLLRAGLYRTTHWRTGEPEYSLYPRQPRNQRGGTMEVELDGESVRLMLERPGYFSPLGRVGPTELDHGAQYPISGHPEIEKMVLPKRDFWILRADPDTPGAFATLGRPTVGEHFTLLVSDGLGDDVKRLQELGLLQSQAPQRLFDGWTEFPAAMVIANLWTEATGVSADLRDALTPTSGISISVSGGLRIPRTGAWLADGPPTVQVNSFFLDTHLTVEFNGVEIFSQPVEPNATVEVPWRGPGVYQLDAEVRGDGYQRLVNLIDWDELPPAPPETLGQELTHLGRGTYLAGPDLITDGGPA